MKNLSTNDAFPEFKHHAAFDLSVPSLEELMLKGDDKDTWISICEKVGQFLATTRDTFNKTDVATELPIESIKKRSVLGEWIVKMNNSWDVITSMIPEGRTTNLNMEKIRERGNQAAELTADSLNLDNLVTKNVQLLPGQQYMQINFEEVDLVYGPLGLEAARFVADILVKYHQQLKLEHNIRYVTSDSAKSFGLAYVDKANSTEADSKHFWAQTSLLAGWEIIRRVTEDESLRELSRQNEIDLVDVFEAGLRLIYNERIDSIGFMIIVALSEV